MNQEEQQEKIYYIVYKTTNLINGKIYIGVHGTNDIEDGYLGSGSAIKNAVKKYGRENFIREILFTFETPEEAGKMERDLVTEEFINRKDNYNLKEGGMYGGKLSEETKEKMKHFWSGNEEAKEYLRKIAKQQKGWKHTEETKGKMKAKILSQEIKDKISSSLTGRKQSDESIEKRRKANTGKKRSREFCERMRERKHSQETIEKIRKSNLGRKHTEETKEKNRQFHLGKNHSEETKEKIRKASTGKMHSEESKEKMREAAIKREARKKRQMIDKG